MKNLNLSLITLVLSSLLVGCGMKGPLYKETPTASEEKPVETKQDSNAKIN